MKHPQRKAIASSRPFHTEGSKNATRLTVSRFPHLIGTAFVIALIAGLTIYLSFVHDGIDDDASALKQALAIGRWIPAGLFVFLYLVGLVSRRAARRRPFAVVTPDMITFPRWQNATIARPKSETDTTALVVIRWVNQGRFSRSHETLACIATRNDDSTHTLTPLASDLKTEHRQHTNRFFRDAIERFARRAELPVHNSINLTKLTPNAEGKKRSTGFPFLVPTERVLAEGAAVLDKRHADKAANRQAASATSTQPALTPSDDEHAFADTRSVETHARLLVNERPEGITLTASTFPSYHSIAFALIIATFLTLGVHWLYISQHVTPEWNHWVGLARYAPAPLTVLSFIPRFFIQRRAAETPYLVVDRTNLNLPRLGVSFPRDDAALRLVRYEDPMHAETTRPHTLLIAQRRRGGAPDALYPIVDPLAHTRHYRLLRQIAERASLPVEGTITLGVLDGIGPSPADIAAHAAAVLRERASAQSSVQGA